MTSEDLKHRIARHIRQAGPLPLAEYVHWCMADKTHGYYTNQEVIGSSADFITAPEVSQIFGELIGGWAIHTWQELGSPDEFNFVEIGPGRGTLMKDMLRTARVSSTFCKAANITLVETSPLMEERQRATLAEEDRIEWVRSISKLPDRPTILIANEFLDVLPFRQYVKTNSTWQERCIGLENDGNDLVWTLGSGHLQEHLLPKDHEAEPEGAVFEISNTRESHVLAMAERISKVGGAALYIDYGHVKTGFGDTFQALQSHKSTDPLETPGTADLTNHVDFEALARTISDTAVTCHPFIKQSEFLLTLGLLERAGQLGSQKSTNEQDLISRQVERLAAPDQMGELFKVFCFSTLPSLWPFDKVS